MKLRRATKIAAGIYGAWCAAAVGLALRGGEYAISAHLWLMLTGLPSALVSLWLPNASLAGVAGAAFLGFLQWVVLIQIIASWEERMEGEE